MLAAKNSLRKALYKRKERHHQQEKQESNIGNGTSARGAKEKHKIFAAFHSSSSGSESRKTSVSVTDASACSSSSSPAASGTSSSSERQNAEFNDGQLARVRIRPGHEVLLRLHPLSVDIESVIIGPQPSTRSVETGDIAHLHERHYRSRSISAQPPPVLLDTTVASSSLTVPALRGILRGSILTSNRYSPFKSARSRFSVSRHEHPTVFDFEGWHTALDPSKCSSFTHIWLFCFILEFVLEQFMGRIASFLTDRRQLFARDQQDHFWLAFLIISDIIKAVTEERGRWKVGMSQPEALL